MLSAGRPDFPPSEPERAQGLLPSPALTPLGPGRGQGLGWVRSQRRPLALSWRERAEGGSADVAQRVPPPLRTRRRLGAHVAPAVGREAWKPRAE